MKRLVVAAGAVALLVLGAVPASAHFTEFQMAPRAGLDQSSDTLFFRMRWRCPNGETAGGGVTIRQGTTEAPNGIGILCTGNNDFAPLTFDGSGFHFGPARAIAHFTFNPDGNVFKNSRDITIGNCSNISWCPG
jgi:hypothetical protein